MKNTIRILGIVALVAIIGFSMAACDNGGDSDGGDVYKLEWATLNKDRTEIEALIRQQGWNVETADNDNSAMAKGDLATTIKNYSDPSVTITKSGSETGSFEKLANFSKDGISAPSGLKTWFINNKANVPLVGIFDGGPAGAVFIYITKGSKSGSGGNTTDVDNSNNPKLNPNIAEMDRWLKAQPANTPATAYTYKLNVNNLGGTAYDSGSVGEVLITNNTKYVKLDLSGSPISSIPWDAFKNWYNDDIDDYCETLVGITIPNSVTSIQPTAFKDCINLTNVTIPTRVTSIGYGAFQGCAITSVTIPASVTSIGGQAFQSCIRLNSITFQGTIAEDKLGSVIEWNNNEFTSPFNGDLRDKYLAGGIGTYTTTAPVSSSSVWTKQ